ncbi:MAG: tetratricopeptide repeat protein [Candidatus Riflebacteria bacterium]|nr:tetratricopeptide repeat protein [Candidatus Riflebacteria bacterium]
MTRLVLVTLAVFALNAWYYVDRSPAGWARDRADSLRKQALVEIEQRRYASALPLLHEVLQLTPDSTDAWHDLARCLVVLGNEAGARSAIRRLGELGAHPEELERQFHAKFMRTREPPAVPPAPLSR